MVYSVLEEQLISCEGNEYTAYGVQCPEYGCAISDISLNGEKIGDFVELLNAGELELIHLKDVVEDFIDELQ